MRFVLNLLSGGSGVRKGIDEDDLVALQLGKTRSEELTQVQQKYKDKLKQKLAEVQQVQLYLATLNPCQGCCSALCRKLSYRDGSRQQKTSSSPLAS